MNDHANLTAARLQLLRVLMREYWEQVTLKWEYGAFCSNGFFVVELGSNDIRMQLKLHELKTFGVIAAFRSKFEAQLVTVRQAPDYGSAEVRESIDQTVSSFEEALEELKR